MAPTVGDWLHALDDRYPPSWAEPWDNVGLQVGDRHAEAPSALVALDPTARVVEEAAGRGCRLLITHHPLVFRPLERLDLSDPVARVVAGALARGVAVVACHTNADVASPGVTDALAEALGLGVTGVLRPTEAGSRVKLVTFVPVEATGKVLDAVAGAGGGIIGEYTYSSFRVRGTGTFLPGPTATPAVGERGTLNEVEEDRLEMMVPRDHVAAAVRALIEAHPYEEVAYDLIPVQGAPGLGLGRMAVPDEPLPAAALADRCRERLGGEVRTAGDLSRTAERIALCGGSGASLIPEAIRSGADVLVTGDVKHHQALDAAEAGLAVIDAGHHGTEWPFIPRLTSVLEASVAGGRVLVSESRTDPFSRP
jgi:dinuclear metal center YbgI/SA1388 family protein